MVEWELVLVCTLVLCEHALNSLATACPSAHTAWAVNFPPCLYELEPCGRLYRDVQPETHSGAYKGILHHSKHSCYVSLSFKGPQRWLCKLCQHLCNPSSSFSLFLWKILLWCPYSNVIQSSRSHTVEMFMQVFREGETQRWFGIWEKSNQTPLVFVCLCSQTHMMNKSYQHILTLLLQK